MSVLVDTSVWIDYLRGRETAATRGLEAVMKRRPSQVATTEPIVMELLAGAADEMTQEAIERLANGLPTLTVDPTVDYRSAAAVYRACRRSGRTVRNLADCLIAAVAMRHDAQLLHEDVDFETIAAVTPLDSQSLR